MRKSIFICLFLATAVSIMYSCQSEAEIELTSYISNGKDIYRLKCQNCHGENGEGLGTLAPPLTDSNFLKINKQRLACFIKNGSQEPMVIHGKTYDSKMPAFPEMENIDIAQVMVYITNAFGNKQGMYRYEQVAKDLSQCPK